MITAVVDTTVVIHVVRKNPTALAWLAGQSGILAITPITWMEVMATVANKRAQADTLTIVQGFEMVYLTPADMDWAMQQMLLHKFSKGVKTMDCFIASVVHRLNVPICTHNVKDFLKILPDSLVIQPY